MRAFSHTDFFPDNSSCWPWQAGVSFSTYHQVSSIMEERNSPWAFPTCLTSVASCASVCTLRLRTKLTCFPADCLSLFLQYGKHRELVLGEFRSKWTSSGLDKALAQRNFQTSISSPWQLQSRHVVRLKKLIKKSVRGSWDKSVFWKVQGLEFSTKNPCKSRRRQPGSKSYPWTSKYTSSMNMLRKHYYTHT